MIIHINISNIDFCTKTEYFNIIFGNRHPFTADGHCSQLHYVPVYNSELCFDDNYCWSPQGCGFHGNT